MWIFLSSIKSQGDKGESGARVILKILLRQLDGSCKGEQTEEKVEHTECNEYESHV